MMREIARQSMPPAEPPPIHSVSNTSVPGPAGTIPVRLYRPNATAPPAVDRVLPRRRLRAVRSRQPRRALSLHCERDRIRRGLGRVPAGARSQVPGAARGLLRRAGRARRARRRVGIRSGTSRRLWRQRRRQPGGGGGAAWRAIATDRLCGTRASSTPSPTRRATTASMRELATGYMLSRESMQWFWNCYLATSARMPRMVTPRCCGVEDLARAATGDGRHGRVRPVARRGRSLCRPAACRRRAGRRPTLPRHDPWLRVDAGRDAARGPRGRGPGAGHPCGTDLTARRRRVGREHRTTHGWRDADARGSAMARRRRPSCSEPTGSRWRDVLARGTAIRVGAARRRPAPWRPRRPAAAQLSRVPAAVPRLRAGRVPARASQCPLQDRRSALRDSALRHARAGHVGALDPSTPTMSRCCASCIRSSRAGMAAARCPRGRAAAARRLLPARDAEDRRWPDLAALLALATDESADVETGSRGDRARDVHVGDDGAPEGVPAVASCARDGRSRTRATLPHDGRRPVLGSAAVLSHVDDAAVGRVSRERRCVHRQRAFRGRCRGARDRRRRRDDPVPVVSHADECAVRAPGVRASGARSCPDRQQRGTPGSAASLRGAAAAGNACLGVRADRGGRGDLLQRSRRHAGPARRNLRRSVCGRRSARRRSRDAGAAAARRARRDPDSRADVVQRLLPRRAEDPRGRDGRRLVAQR